MHETFSKDIQVVMQQLIFVRINGFNLSLTSYDLRFLSRPSFQTLNDWANLFREVCTYSMENIPQLVSTIGETSQIEES